MIMKILKYIPLLLIVASLSCTKVFDAPTEFSLFGNVTLEDETDYSGITVEVYSLAKMDTAVTNLQARFPSVGFPITQAAIFDHREKTPLYTTTTDENGDWALNKIEEGEYNIVARKAGYGWKYVYNVIAATEMPEIELKPEIRVEGTLDAYTVWGPDQHYVVTGDITVPENGQLIVDKGTWIRFDGYHMIYVNGAFHTNEDEVEFIHWVGEDGAEWNGMRINENMTIVLSNSIIKNCSKSVRIINNKNVIIEKIFTKEIKSDFFNITDCDNVKINNTINLNNVKTFYLLNCNFSEISNNIFVSNEDALEIEDTEANAKNNYFLNNEIALHPHFRKMIKISNNRFENNEIGIFCSGAEPSIKYNSFYSNKMSIYLGVEFSSFDSKPEINYNNFFANEYAIYIWGVETGSNRYDLNCKNNYWNYFSNEEIDEIVWDKKDYENNPDFIGNVIYTPFLFTSVDSAGVY